MKQRSAHKKLVRPLLYDLMKREGVGHGGKDEEQINHRIFRSMRHKLHYFYPPTAEEANAYRKIQENGEKKLLP